MGEKGVYNEQQKLSFMEFCLELPNFFAVAASAILTGSLIAWMDFVDSLGNVIASGFVAILSGKLKRNLKFEYNYGVGKIEAIASLCCEFFVLSGLVSVCIFSVMEILSPRRPSDLLFYAVLLKVVNVGFDCFFFIRQRRLSKSGSRIAKSEFKAVTQDFAFDAIALLSLLVCYVFRNVRAMWYFAPALCLLFSVYFFADSISRIRAAIFELTDRTLSEDAQLLILRALNSCYASYAELISVNSRTSGGRVYIDLNIRFDGDTSYDGIRAFQKTVSEKICSEVPGSVVSIVISEECAPYGTEKRFEGN